MKPWLRPLYDTDNPPGSETTPPPPAPPPTFTQQQLSAHVGRARTEGRDTAIKDLLAELGLEKADDLKTLVTTAKERAQAEQTEAERLKGEAERYKSEAERARADATQTLIDTRIETGALRVTVGEQVYRAIKPQRVAQLIDRSSIAADLGARTVTGVDEALAALVASDPYLFESLTPETTAPRGTPPATPPARSGTPRTAEQIKKDAEQRLRASGLYS